MRPGVWVVFLWVTISASKPVGYWFEDGTVAASADASEGSFIDRNVYLFLIIGGLGVLLQRQNDCQTTLPKLRCLLIFYFYLLLSVIWSDFPFISFKRWFKDFGDVIMILVVLTDREPQETFRKVFIRSAYLLIPLSVLFMKWYPALGRYFHRWTYQSAFCGITTNKNSLGLLAMVAGLFMLWQVVDIQRETERKFRLRTAWPTLVVLLMCLWILFVAQSATALSCFILGTIIFFTARLRYVRANVRKFGWGLLGIGIVMVTFTFSSEFRGAIADFLGRDATLTDRTLIWEAALSMHTNPILGTGFGIAWITEAGLSVVDGIGASVTHAHNGYLETYLNSGLIGALLLLSILVGAGRNAAAHLFEGTTCGPLFLALFLGGLFYNYTEVAFNRGNVLGFLLWFIAVAGVDHLSRTQIRIATHADNEFNSLKAE